MPEETTSTTVETVVVDAFSLDSKENQTCLPTIPSSIQNVQDHGTPQDFGFFPVPRHLRFDPDHPPHFGLWMNIGFAFAAAFTASNLAYCTPLLIQLSSSFEVSYSKIGIVPSMVMAGYAIGLAFISPLGDLLRRRQIILTLLLLTTFLSLGLALTTSLNVFAALTFLVGVFSVVPQVLVPLAADLAPAHRRATAISLVFSGIMFGTLLGRVLAGVIAEYQYWETVYYFGTGIQAVLLVGAYFIIPDYPRKNAEGGETYFKILGTMVKYVTTEPTVIQGCISNFCQSSASSCFWVVLTFLLGDEHYRYSTLVIGLFGLLGAIGVVMAPVAGHIVDRVVPWWAMIVSIVFMALFQAVFTAAGDLHVAAIVVSILGMEGARQVLLVATTSNIIGVAPEARARLNALSILSFFLGGVVGSSVGPPLYDNYGWRAAALFMLGMSMYLCAVLVLWIRGPHVQRETWLGYEGGWEIRKRRPENATEGEIIFALGEQKMAQGKSRMTGEADSDSEVGKSREDKSVVPIGRGASGEV